MHKLYREMLEVMKCALSDFASALPNPEPFEQGEVLTYRYKNTDIYHTVVLKLAQMQSNLHAALILNEHNHVLEQAALQRVIDEAAEDILFLVFAVTNNQLTEKHEEYLRYFWAEEFTDANNPVSSHQSRGMVSREKIRAYNSRIAGSGQSEVSHVTKFLHKMYSGFVHGASPHIMELYEDNPPRFETEGTSNPNKLQSYTEDLWNYMYRAFVSHIHVAKLFGAENHIEALLKHKARFESACGVKY